MKRCVWYNNKDIRIEEAPRPRPAAGELLVKVISCGICGSDVVEWYRLPKAPLVPGHEMGGEVVEAGAGVTAFGPGDRVFVAPKVPCNRCTYCKRGQHPLCTAVKERLPGAFSEYIAVPEILVKNGTYRLPEKITYDQSTFIEPLACVVRAQRLAALPPGASVVVIGCGMSGLLHVKLAKTKSFRVVAVDVNPARLVAAGRSGADLCIDAAENVAARLIDSGCGKADGVILCTGALSAVETAWACVEKGGAVVFFAVPAPQKQVVIPVNDLWMKEVRVLTSYYCGPPDIAAAMEHLESARIAVDDMITHRLGLKDVAEGFRLVLEGRESIKVIVRPSE
jgi:L-iditol 2-dehydrogenase